MPQVLAPPEGDTSDGPQAGRFALALAEHEAGFPATCTGCVLRCDKALNAGGLAVWCPLFPLRRAAYFAETQAQRHQAAARGSIWLPPG